MGRDHSFILVLLITPTRYIPYVGEEKGYGRKFTLVLPAKL